MMTRNLPRFLKSAKPRATHFTSILRILSVVNYPGNYASTIITKTRLCTSFIFRVMYLITNFEKKSKITFYNTIR